MRSWRVELAQHLAQLALTEQLAARQAAAGTKKSLPSTCGRRQYPQQQQTLTVRTVIGPVRYVRLYHYCRTCGRGRAPQDEALGQGARDVSPVVVRLVCAFGEHVSFGAAANLLDQSNPAIGLSACQLETVAEAVGTLLPGCLQREAVLLVS